MCSPRSRGWTQRQVGGRRSVRRAPRALYGAQGVKGYEAVARQLDALAGYVATLITARRGLIARLHYLTRSDRAREAGLTVTDRALRAWSEGRRSPYRGNLERIESVYRVVRRENVARYLTARLDRAGRGTRVVIHPSTSPRSSAHPANGRWSTGR
ncbi:hypothetical protein ACE1SV_76600 [Streptomyces sennicomposti]